VNGGPRRPEGTSQRGEKKRRLILERTGAGPESFSGLGFGRSRSRDGGGGGRTAGNIRGAAAPLT